MVLFPSAPPFFFAESVRPFCIAPPRTNPFPSRGVLPSRLRGTRPLLKVGAPATNFQALQLLPPPSPCLFKLTRRGFFTRHISFPSFEELRPHPRSLPKLSFFLPRGTQDCLPVLAGRKVFFSRALSFVNACFFNGQMSPHDIRIPLRSLTRPFHQEER